MSFFEKLFGSFSDKELKRIKPLADKVLSLEPEMQKLTDEQLQAKTTEFKDRLAKGETLDDLLPEAFAVCREADCLPRGGLACVGPQALPGTDHRRHRAASRLHRRDADR